MVMAVIAPVENNGDGDDDDNDNDDNNDDYDDDDDFDDDDSDDDDFEDDDFDDDDNIGGLWCAHCTSSNGLRAGHDLPAPTVETLLHITTLRTPVQEIVTPFLQLQLQHYSYFFYYIYYYYYYYNSKL